MLDEAKLVRDLGPAEDGDERPFRVLEDPAERGELALHQEPGGGGLEEARDRVDRGLGSVGRREGVVHVAVAEPGQVARELGVVGLLLGMEAEVLEQHDLPRGESPRPRLRDGADAVWRDRHVRRGELPEPGRHRGHRVLRVGPAPGAAEVRGEDDRGAPREAVADRGEGGPQAGVVAHPAAVERHVQVRAEEHALTRELELPERELRHTRRDQSDFVM